MMEEKDFEEQFPSLEGLELKQRADLKLLRELISILENHCGEHGDNEGAVETLNRIIKERDEKLDKRKVRESIYKFCVLEVGQGQGNLDYRGIKLIQELGL